MSDFAQKSVKIAISMPESLKFAGKPGNQYFIHALHT